MKILPKIPLPIINGREGVTLFGIAAATSSYAHSVRNSNEAIKANTLPLPGQQEQIDTLKQIHLVEVNQVIENQTTIIENQAAIIENQAVLLENQAKDNTIVNNIPNNDTINKSNNYLESNFFSLEDIKNYYNNFIEYFSSFDLETQLALLNLFNSLFLLSLLFSYVTGLYGNYLIEKLNLKTKYPKISKILEYRLTYQGYYFKYLFVVAVLAIFLNLFVNLLTLLYK